MTEQITTQGQQNSGDNSSVLIVKGRKDKLNVKIRRRMSKGYSPNDYDNVLNPRDPSHIAILLKDLEYLYGLNTEKVIMKIRGGHPLF